MFLFSTSIRLLFAICLAFFASHSMASPILYNSESAFLGAIGSSADISENFNSFSVDTSFQNSSLDVGSFTLNSSGTFHNNLNIIDVPFFVFSSLSVNNSPLAAFFVNSVTTASIAFDNEINAFGATFAGLDTVSTSWEFTTSSGLKSLNLDQGSIYNGFFGFVLDPGETLTSINIVGASDGFGMDNLLLSTSNTVPEPAPLVLIGFGLAAIGYIRKRTSA